MGTMASLITSITSVYSTAHPDADQRKHESSASLAFVRGIHRRPVNSPHKWPVTRKMFPFDDVIMNLFSVDTLCSGDIVAVCTRCHHALFDVVVMCLLHFRVRWVFTLLLLLNRNETIITRCHYTYVWQTIMGFSVGDISVYISLLNCNRTFLAWLKLNWIYHHHLNISALMDIYNNFTLLNCATYFQQEQK